VFVAHRPALLALADRVLVVRDGRVREGLLPTTRATAGTDVAQART
jgi:ABC-type protease/lipase transport system fused ATPase/permease subunit